MSNISFRSDEKFAIIDEELKPLEEDIKTKLNNYN